MAVDALPYGHPFRVGLIGTYGNRWANHALAESDCLLVLGSRLDVRQTGSDTRAFKGGRQIIHVDCDAAEINNRVQGCEPIVASVEAFIETALVIAPRLPVADRTDWSSHIAELAARWPDTRELEGRIEGINPNVFMHALSRSCSDAAAYIVDVGQHQMWAAQSLELGPRQRFMTSGGMGSMGFALPAAIGACLALDRQPVVCIAGDGGLQCNVQELETLARLNLPVKIAVLNNRCLGMVRQFQETYFEGRYQSTAWGYGAPSFVRIVEAYGVQAARLESPRDAADRISWLCSDPHSPALVEVAIDITANAYPKTSFGHPLSEMEPEPDPASSVTEIASAKHRVEDSGRARMPLQAG
jgi:acetolactate synthase-1/2/3 large subunit